MITAFCLPIFPARATFKRAILSAVLASVSWTAWAHGGEDHGTDASPVMSTSIAPRASAQTEDFELVAQLDGKTLTFTLDRFTTNAPVVDAQIEVESGTVLKAVAQQVAPGIYTVEADALALPGKYPLSFSVQAGDTSDLLAATLDISPPIEKTAHVRGGGEWVTWTISAVVLVAGLGLVVQRRRKWTRKHPH